MIWEDFRQNTSKHCIANETAFESACPYFREKRLHLKVLFPVSFLLIDSGNGECRTLVIEKSN